MAWQGMACGLTAGLVFLSGCSVAVSDKDALLNACTKNESRKVCECMANAAAEKLEPDMLHIMALEAQGKEEESRALMEALPADKKIGFVTFAMQEGARCALTQGQ